MLVQGAKIHKTWRVLQNWLLHSNLHPKSEFTHTGEKGVDSTPFFSRIRTQIVKFSPRKYKNNKLTNWFLLSLSRITFYSGQCQKIVSATLLSFQKWQWYRITFLNNIIITIYITYLCVSACDADTILLYIYIYLSFFSTSHNIANMVMLVYVMKFYGHYYCVTQVHY